MLADALRDLVREPVHIIFSFWVLRRAVEYVVARRVGVVHLDGHHDRRRLVAGHLAVSPTALARAVHVGALDVGRHLAPVGLDLFFFIFFM